MKLVVIGAGMYVTGRGGHAPGTILASLCEASRSHPLLKVTIAARNTGNESVVKESAREINRRLGTRLPVDYRTVPADPEVAVAGLAGDAFDAAIVCVPDELHYPYIKALLQAGMHVLAVKPFVTTAWQASELAGMAKSDGLYGAVEYHKRFDEANLLAKRLLTQGAIGSLLYAVVEYSQRIVIPTEMFRAWADRSNIFQYLAIHYVDLIWFLTGFKPLRASAVGLKEVLSARGIDTYDNVHATIIWEKPGGREFISQFNTNWIDPMTSSAMSDQKYSLVGSTGRLEMDQKNRGISLVAEGQPTQAINPYFSDFFPGHDGKEYFQGYGHESIKTFITDVLELMAGKVTLYELQNGRPSFADAIPSTAVLETVNRSLQRGGVWCEVEDLKA